jgi:hypothetical protein
MGWMFADASAPPAVVVFTTESQRHRGRKEIEILSLSFSQV